MRKIIRLAKAAIKKTGFYHARREQKELAKLRHADLTKINFGCAGNMLAGWTNTDGGDGKYWTAPAHPDIIQLDVWKFLAHTPDGVARFISSEQFFEHFDRHEGHRMIREWFRILVPGGILRIQTVDLTKEIQVYLDQCPGVSWQKDVLPHRYGHIKRTTDPYGKLIEGEVYTRAMLLNNGFHMKGHKYIYDFEAIEQSLRLAGFSNIKAETFGHSDHEELRGIDRHDGGDTGRHWIPKNVLTAEAEKPTR